MIDVLIRFSRTLSLSCHVFFFLMIRRPPRSTLDRSSAASDVYKRQILSWANAKDRGEVEKVYVTGCLSQRYAPELKDGIPQVDAWFGTRDMPRLLKTLKADYKHELVGELALIHI